MHSFFLNLKRTENVSALLFIVLGIVFLFCPGISTRLVCRGIGVGLITFGVFYHIIPYLSGHERDFISYSVFTTGLIVTVIGVWVMLRPETVLAFLHLLAGIVMILDGLQSIRQAAALKELNFPRWRMAACSGILMAVLGVILIFNPFAVIKTLVRMIGLFLLCDGIIDIWMQT